MRIKVSSCLMRWVWSPLAEEGSGMLSVAPKVSYPANGKAVFEPRSSL